MEEQLKELEIAKHCLDEHKAIDIEAIEVGEISPFASYYVLATAPNVRALGAYAELLEDAFEKGGVEVTLKEGSPDSGWRLVDAGEVIVHIFLDVNRKEFGLEQLVSSLTKIDGLKK